MRRFKSLAFTILSFSTLHFLNSYDWLWHQYIHNIQIKHLHDTYLFKKQQIKLKLNLKITSKISSQISLIHLFCSLFWAILEKHAIRGLDLLGFSHYLWKFWIKQRFTLGNSTKLCYNSWKFQGQKPRPLVIPHDIFTPGNSTSFLIDLWNFHMFLE